MRIERKGFAFAAAAAAAAWLALAACSDSLAIRDNLEKKVEYAVARYTMTVESDNPTYGTVNIDSRSVGNEEEIQLIATPVPYIGGLFREWTVVSGTATIADPNSANTTARVVGTDATIRAVFAPSRARKWTAIAASSSGQYLAAAVNLFQVETNLEGGSIFTSSDYGATWTLRRNSRDGMTWTSIASDSTGRYLAATAGQGDTIYTSADSGETWTARSSGLPVISEGSTVPGADWTSIASDGTGRILIASVMGGSIYTSADYGATWTEHAVDGSLTYADWSKVSSSENGSVLTASLSGGGAYYSQDGGASWAPMTLPEGSPSGAYATQNAAGTRFVVAISGPRGTGGGATNDMTSGNKWNWARFATSLNYTSWSAVACDAEGLRFLGAINGGALYISDNYCNGNYSPLNGERGLPLNAGWTCVSSNAAGDRLAAGANGDHIYVSSNRGQTWSLAL